MSRDILRQEEDEYLDKLGLLEVARQLISLPVPLWTIHFLLPVLRFSR